MRPKLLKQSSLVKPIAISLLIHVGVVFLVYRSTLGDVEVKKNQGQASAMKIVLLAAKPSLIPAAVPLSNDKGRQLEPITEIKHSVLEQQSNQQNQKTNAARALETFAEEGIRQSPDLPKLNGISTEDSTDSTSSTISPTALSSAISHYMSSYSSGLNQNWLDKCYQYQQEHGSNECPKESEAKYRSHQDEWAVVEKLNQANLDAQRARQYKDQMDFLASLPISESKTVAAVVKQRIDFNKEYFLALTGVTVGPQILTSDDWVLTEPSFGGGIGQRPKNVRQADEHLRQIRHISSAGEFEDDISSTAEDKMAMEFDIEPSVNFTKAE